MENNSKSAKFIIIVASIIAVISIVIAMVFVFTSKDRKLKNYLNLGQKYLTEMDYEEAIASFEKAIEIDPMSVDAYFGLADAYVKMDDIEAAIDVASHGYELTGDERLKELIDSLELLLESQSNDGTDIALNTAAPTQTDEELSTEEVIIPIAELINCPTICGIPWREAGGASGMYSLLPELTTLNTTRDEVVLEQQDKVNDTHFTYQEYDTGRKEIVLTCDDGSRANYDFWYAEESDGKIAHDKGFTVSYTQGISPSTYADGFYQYLNKTSFSIDELVSILAMDPETIKNSEETEYMSDMGTMTVSYFTYDDAPRTLYHFVINGEEEWSISLSEVHDEYTCISMSIKDKHY